MEKTITTLPDANFISTTPINRPVPYDFTSFLYIDGSNTKKYLSVGKQRWYSFPKYHAVARSLFVGFDTSVVIKNQRFSYCKKWEHRLHIRGPVKYYIGEAITVGSGYAYGNWGHSLQDFLHPFLLFPEDVKQRSTILTPCVDSVIEILNILGYPRSKMLKMKKVSGHMLELLIS